MTVDQVFETLPHVLPGHIPTQYESSARSSTTSITAWRPTVAPRTSTREIATSCHDANDGEGMALWEFRPSSETPAWRDEGRESRGRLPSTRKPRWCRRTCSTWTPEPLGPDCMRAPAPSADTPMPYSVAPVSLSASTYHHGGRRGEQPLHRASARFVKRAGVTATKVSKEVCNWNGTGAGSVSNVGDHWHTRELA